MCVRNLSFRPIVSPDATFQNYGGGCRIHSMEIPCIAAQRAGNARTLFQKILVALGCAMVLGLSGCSGLVASKALVLAPPSGLSISTSSLRDGQVGSAYLGLLTASGGRTPYTWSVAAGSSLPSWMTLNVATGQLSGTPSQSGTVSFTIQVMDCSSTPQSESELFSVNITGPSSLSITTSFLPNGRVSTAYATTAIAATGGTPPYMWSVSTGSLPPGLALGTSTGQVSGTPTQSGAFTFTIQVIDSGSPAKTATKQYTVTIVPAGALTISTTSLSQANVGFPYQTTLIATGGTLPYTWSITSGLLPAGLNLSASGVISGTATQSGPFTFTVRVKDASSQTATNPESLTVGPGGSRVACTPGGTDGPASLPSVCIDTTMPNTSGYVVTTVANGADLQAAIDAAGCGTVLRLAAGATYTGNFSLPAKSCDASHWIIIRSDVPDSSLPPQGTRMTPAMVTAANLAKITTANSNAAIATSGNSAHYWFFALEIAVDTSVAQNFGLIVFGNGSHDLTIDRCYVHGNSTGNDMRRGVTVNGATIAVVDSYIANFHTDTTDAQGIEGWSGAGPFKVVNNHIEGAAQCVMFGGGDPSIANLVPSDIEIRYNHMIIPLAWRGLSGYLIKHPFELKNAQRVLVEGNIMENSWGGQGVSNGTALVFTPRNQGGNCPWCTVQDVTIRYNIIRHAGEGFNINGEDDIHPSLPGAKFSIHDDLFDDMDYTVWGGGGTGRLFKLSQTSGATVFSYD